MPHVSRNGDVRSDLRSAVSQVHLQGPRLAEAKLCFAGLCITSPFLQFASVADVDVCDTADRRSALRGWRAAQKMRCALFDFRIRSLLSRPWFLLSGCHALEVDKGAGPRP